MYDKVVLDLKRITCSLCRKTILLSCPSHPLQRSELCVPRWCARRDRWYCIHVWYMYMWTHVHVQYMDVWPKSKVPRCSLTFTRRKDGHIHAHDVVMVTSYYTVITTWANLYEHTPNRCGTVPFLQCSLSRCSSMFSVQQVHGSWYEWWMGTLWERETFDICEASPRKGSTGWKSSHKNVVVVSDTKRPKCVLLYPIFYLIYENLRVMCSTF